LRNTGRRAYRIKQSKTATDTRLIATCKAIKMTTRLIMLIESKISEKWSPEHVSDWLRKEESIDISYATMYLHIWSDKQFGGYSRIGVMHFRVESARLKICVLLNDLNLFSRKLVLCILFKMGQTKNNGK
jgi:IS30 family transposase